jgi:membrane protease subunit (stomatin/prohibitin family)
MNPFNPFGSRPPQGDLEGADARQTYYWKDLDKGENVIYRLPRNIRLNDNIVVREDEMAIFFRDGKALHLFDRPDRYALTTETIPVLGALTKAITGIVQIGEIYWVQRREFRANFGTSEPLVYRDRDFGLVRLRIFGQFAYRVADPMLLITQFVGTRGMTHSEEIVRWLRDQIVVVINDTLGELKDRKGMGVLDMPANLQEIEQLVLGRIDREVGPYGLAITKLAGLNINLPEEVQTAVDKRGAMTALGVNYLQYATGKAIEGAGAGAARGGEGANLAGIGAGAGAGFAIGHAMAAGMKGGTESGVPPTPPAGAAAGQCPKCAATAPPGSRFCPSCGTPLANACPSCTASVDAGASFCPFCGTRMHPDEKESPK